MKVIAFELPNGMAHQIRKSGIKSILPSLDWPLNIKDKVLNLIDNDVNWRVNQDLIKIISTHPWNQFHESESNIIIGMSNSKCTRGFISANGKNSIIPCIIDICDIPDDCDCWGISWVSSREKISGYNIGSDKQISKT